jgi:hypothetical protein
MSVKKLIEGLIHEIGLQFNSMDTVKEREEVVKKIDPELTPCGFLAIAGVVCCPCGEPVKVETQAPEHTQKEIEEALAESDGSLKVHEVQSVHYDESKDSSGRQMHATNVGHSMVQCVECRTRFLMAWEMCAVKINDDVKLPWVNQDGPDSSSSGQSFAETKSNGTVH